MKICGVVAEFNPLHNGHQFLLHSLRRSGATHMVAVMSGNFVQRGEPAFAEKHLRTAWALACGCDLVLELPLPYAMATAQRFAFGAMGILHSLGCVDMLGFGSEAGDSQPLYALARLLQKPDVSALIREKMAEKITYAKARQMAVEQVAGPELAALLSHPNNTLGLEYIGQALALGWNPQVVTIRREGAAHDSHIPHGGMPSASFIRSTYADAKALEGLVPPEALPLYSQYAQLLPGRLEKLETAILSYLRRLPPDRLAALPDLSEGLENRLAIAIGKAGSLEELYFGVKTKRYTLARIRRLVLSAFLEIESGFCRQPPPYLRVLGMNSAGREILSRAKKTASLPLSVSLARLESLGGYAGQLARLEAASTDQYALCLPQPLPCGWDYRAPAVIVK
ncbi:nucleotidyltransferase family protein [Oscillospiraceae bacterium MB08-C2-2]|nr:nucleotidyltransferase family protein [Oscillospiraceae bacterium MB08-C2-2]